MAIPISAVGLQTQAGFWTYKLNDLVTGIIGLAALMASLTGVWVAYLWRRRLECNLGDMLRISYGGASKRNVRFFVDVYALNKGAQPGVITRMAIELSPIDNKERVAVLRWREITKSEDIGEKGKPRRIWTVFAGFATAVLVPKYDARLIEAAFYSEEDVTLEAGVTYTIQLQCWVAGVKKPVTGARRQLTMTKAMVAFVNTRATADESGIVERHLFLASDDGTDFIAPSSSNWMLQPKQSELIHVTTNEN
jgi:hypothetical protein